MAFTESIGGYWTPQTKAIEVEKLIETGGKCGIESTPEFFREIVGIVYENPMADFMPAMAKMLESIKKDKED